MKILVFDNLNKKFIDSISQGGKHEVITIKSENLDKISDEFNDIDIMVGWGDIDDFTKERINSAKNLKWIHTLAAGVDKLPFNYLKKKNIIVTNSSGIHSIPISEHVFGMLLYFTRSLNVFGEQKSLKEWRKASVYELFGKIIGIIGIGSIGKEIAKKAKAFDMTVLGVKNSKCDVNYVDYVYTLDDLNIVLSKSDVVVVALPLTDMTKGLFSTNEFNNMKKDCIFVNIGRGKIVNEKALIKALQRKNIKYACLDVFEEEPLSIESPLWDMKNVIITPHISGDSHKYMERAMQIFLENLTRFENGDSLINSVDLLKQY
ncbi:D-2-hydroxyacid dehydrogenase [Clostridium rectalis]|uniref:D-2-hydroxyacid dehydrogenase n=1 Tax=Clostridium rectalis TaxID=2040295 RepID=UPI000F6306C9|nr:D-2-hydroxyacid dehydrogenase [Clostridium rectalis]